MRISRRVQAYVEDTVYQLIKKETDVLNELTKGKTEYIHMSDVLPPKAIHSIKDFIAEKVAQYAPKKYSGKEFTLTFDFLDNPWLLQDQNVAKLNKRNNDLYRLRYDLPNKILLKMELENTSLDKLDQTIKEEVANACK